MGEIAGNLKVIRDKIILASTKRIPEYQYCQPRLVAVSKLKPPELIIDAYQAGQQHFGENYVNELVDKSNHPSILEKCKEIRWHFIGHLQRNKVNKVLGAPNLYVVETVDNEKIAAALDKAWPKFRKTEDLRLNVMVQVNTSKEEEKNGCALNELLPLVKYVLEDCKNLKLMGIMTIGVYGYDVSNGPNPDFLCLQKCREDIVKEFQIDYKDVELSMGMSSDYEHAIELGSTNVRVGSAIFGERPKKGT